MSIAAMMDGMDGASRPIGTVAFLFTDIVASTEAWEAEPQAMGVAVSRLEALVDEAAPTGRRAVEQGAGDSAVVAFDRATDAAIAAVALQRAIAAESWPTSRSLRVRAALHLGEVEVGPDGTYRGVTMNRCGRLLGAAHGGQTVASGSFLAVLEDADGVAASALDGVVWSDLGAHRLRGIDGPMRIWQLGHPDLQAEFPPLRTVDGRGLRLPGVSSELIGREVELARLSELVGAYRVVTVLGSGGSGKTRIAVELAHRALDHLDDVAWVDLAKIAATNEVAPLVVAELSLHHGAQDPRRRIIEHLRATRALLVLDNCEHVLDEVADLVDGLIAQCPALTVVATSREPLEVSAEAVFRLGPLAVPVEADGSDLLASPAGVVLVDRIARVRPGLVLDAGDAAAAAEICRRLDGIPLALELAAARARSLPLPVVASRLEQRFALLIGGSRGSALARQRTLEASVSWSYDLLDVAEQTALRHLSTFTGPVDLEAAAAVVAVDGADPVDLVTALVDKSLLLEESGPGPARYRMLETVRFFARDRNVLSGEAAACRDRHLAWVGASVAVAAESFEGPRASDAVARLDTMLEEIRAALEWADSTGRTESLQQIAGDLGWYWIWRGLAREGGQWLDRIPDGAGEGASRSAARAAFSRYLMATHCAPGHDEVERAAARAIEAAADAGELGLEAASRLWLGTHRSFHDPIGNRSDLEAAAARCRSHGGTFWSAMAAANLAQSWMFQLHLADASEEIEVAVGPARALGNHQLLAEVLSRRCAIAEDLGAYDDAITALAELDEALAGVATREIRALALCSVARIDLQRGEVDAVVARMQHAVDQYLRDEDLQFVPLLVAPLAEALLAAGRPGDAVAVLEPVWMHPEVRSAKVYAGPLAPVLAAALWCDERRDQARAIAAEALETAGALESEVFEARVLALLGAFDLDDGGPVSADGRLLRAVEVAHQFGHRQLVCDIVEEIGRLELDFGRPEEAAIVLGGAARERDEQRVVLRPWRQDAYLDTIDRTRQALGEADFDDRWERGRQLGLDDLVARCQRGHGQRTRPTFGWDALTDTERRVAVLAADGLSNPQIADAMVVGRETVKSHMASILRKLDLENRTQLARLVSMVGPS